LAQRIGSHQGCGAKIYGIVSIVQPSWPSIKKSFRVLKFKSMTTFNIN